METLPLIVRTSPDLVRAVLTAAKQIKIFKGPDLKVGLCELFYSEFGACHLGKIRLVLNTVFSMWPRHSGNGTYPIPDPCGLYDPQEAFITALRAPDDYPEYLRLRFELLNFIIDTLTEEFKNAS